MRIFSTAIAVVLLGMPGLGACQATANPDTLPVPATPVAVKRILAARPFTLQTPFVYAWSNGSAVHALSVDFIHFAGSAEAGWRDSAQADGPWLQL